MLLVNDTPHLAKNQTTHLCRFAAGGVTKEVHLLLVQTQRQASRNNDIQGVVHIGHSCWRVRKRAEIINSHISGSTRWGEGAIASGRHI